MELVHLIANTSNEITLIATRSVTAVAFNHSDKPKGDAKEGYEEDCAEGGCAEEGKPKDAQSTSCAIGRVGLVLAAAGAVALGALFFMKRK